MMSEDIFDIVVVGAGIVGITTAYEYYNRFPQKKILVIEKESKISTHQTKRNSGVIHSGIYYKPESLKAKNCLLGYQLLLEFAKTNKIKYQITGKLIVAFNENQIESLNKLYEYGSKNGLKGIKLIDNDEITKIEPNCTNAIKAIFVPQSGIISYAEVSNELVNILESKGVVLKLRTRLLKSRQESNYQKLFTNNGNLITKNLVLCCGVYSDKFLSPKFKQNYRILPFKGEYYNLLKDKSHMVKGLIYPVPDLNFPFLGVHLTKNIDGHIEAGPNAVLSLSREGYKKLSFNLFDVINIITWRGFWIFAFKYWKIGLFEITRSLSKRKFTKSLKKLVPDIKKEFLILGKTGIRAQIITKDGELYDDFLLDKNERILNVINAPSPAATSSFAIAREIVNQLEE